MKTIFGSGIHIFKFVIVLFSSLLIVACGDLPEDEPVGDDQVSGVLVNTLINRADWSSSRGRLTVQGNVFSGVTDVYVYDGVYPSVLLGSVKPASDLSWRFRNSYNRSSYVPCSVIVKAGVAEQRTNVSNAPSNCSSAYAGQSNSSTNNPPESVILNPLSSQTIFVGDRINFQGSATDPDGDTNLNYFWNFAGAVPNSTQLSPGNILFNTPGVYRITFTVTDSLGFADPTPAQVTITVNSVNANLPPDTFINSPVSNRTINVGDSLFFSGSAIDPEGGSLTYLWNFGNSGLPASTVQTPGSMRFNNTGTFVITLTAYDSAGLADPTPAVTTITVSNVNTNSGSNPPNGTIVSPASNSTFAKNTTINLVATASDPDGDTGLIYLWDFGGYAPRQTGANVSLALGQTGVLNVRLLVRDSTQLWDPTPATIAINVADQGINNNRAPNGLIVSPASNQTINVGQSINFSATGSDPDGDVISYQWSFGASGIPNSNLRVPGNTQFNQAGVFTITMTTTDIKGMADPTPASVAVTVNAVNTAPETTIVEPAANRTINVGDSIKFTGLATDAENDALTYRWDFGASGVPVNTNLSPGNIRFNQAGTFVVSFIATDSKGMSDLTPARVTIVVNSTNRAPDSTITSPVANVVISEGGQVNFSGFGSDPDGNTPLTYSWNFNGGASNSNLQNPGNVRFQTSGVYRVQFTVTDSLGMSDATPAEVLVTVQTINNVNQAPNATITNPPSNMTVNVGDSVYFTGTATDPENNTPLSYLWNFDGATLNSLVQNPGSVRFNAAGIYLVKLYATDSLGARDASPDVRVITVNGAANQNPPNSEILQPLGSVTVEVGNPVTFRGRGTDIDGDTNFTYLWNFAGVAPNSTSASPAPVIFNNAGTYSISFRVTDSTGLSDPTPALVQVNVTNALSLNEPPNGVIVLPSMDMTIYAGDSLLFNSVGVDPNGDSLSYLWNFSGATTNKFVQNPGAVKFNTPGIYNIALTVSDSYGLSDPTPDSVTVTVRPVATGSAPNSLIVTPSSDIAIYEGDSVSFSGMGLDPDGGAIASYRWNFDGAEPNSTLQNPGSIKFTRAGIYHVRFTVTDIDGMSDPTPDEVVVTVQQYNMPAGNIAPNGIISTPANDMVITVGESINFTATAIDADNNTPFSYRWNFAGAVPNTTIQNPGWVTFNQVGTYRVTLTVTDSAGLSDATPAERIISVQGLQSVNRPPNGSIVSPASDVTINAGDSLLFAGGGTDPESNFPLTYIWDFDGAVPNQVGATAGPITFMQEGTFNVKLKVIDSYGLFDPTPASVVVRVGNTQTANMPPDSTIIAPSYDQTISLGNTLYFSGSGVDPEGGLVSYHWNFGGSGVPDSTLQSPVVTFNQAGTFVVTFTATDNLGLRDPTPATIRITVQDIFTQSGEPNGVITSPPSSPVYINVGDSLTLTSQLSDPNGDTNLLALWNFGTYPIQNQIGQSVRVTFTDKGVVTITLKVRDSTKLWDPTPATITVYVQ